MHKIMFCLLVLVGSNFDVSGVSNGEKTASPNIVSENYDCESLETEKTPIKNHYRKFTQKQRAAMTEYAKVHGIRATAKQFSVPRSTIGNWIKMCDCKVKNLKTECLPRTKCEVKNGDIDCDSDKMNCCSNLINENTSSDCCPQKNKGNHVSDSVADSAYSITSENGSIINTNENLGSEHLSESIHCSDSTMACRQIEYEIAETLDDSTIPCEWAHALNDKTVSGNTDQNKNNHCILSSDATSEITVESKKAKPSKTNQESDYVPSVLNSVAASESANTLRDVVKSIDTNTESVSFTASAIENMNSKGSDSNCGNPNSEIAQTICCHGKQADCVCKQMELVVSQYCLEFEQEQKKAFEEYSEINGIEAAVKHFNIKKSTLKTWCNTDINDNLMITKKDPKTKQITKTPKKIKTSKITKTPKIKQRLRSTKLQKVAVKEYAEKHGIRPAMRHFGIPKSTVHCWLKTDFSDGKKRDCKTGRILCSGRPLTYDKNLDLKILAIVREKQKHKIPIIVKDICSYASRIIKPKFPEFKASRRWASSFIKRHNLQIGRSDLKISNTDFKPVTEGIPTETDHNRNKKDHDNSLRSAATSTLPKSGHSSKCSVKSEKAKKRRLTLKEKLLVKQYAIIHGENEAAKHFNVSKFQVMIWSRTDFNDKRRNCITGNLPRPGRPRKRTVNIDFDKSGVCVKKVKSEPGITTSYEEPESEVTANVKLESEGITSVEHFESEAAKSIDSESGMTTNFPENIKSTTNWEKLEIEIVERIKCEIQSTAICEQLECDIVEATQNMLTIVKTRINSLSETNKCMNQNQESSNIYNSSAELLDETLVSLSEKDNSPNKILESDIATGIFASEIPEESLKSMTNFSANQESDLSSDIVASPNETINTWNENSDSSKENLRSTARADKNASVKKDRNRKTGLGYTKGRPLSYDAGLDFVILAYVLEQQERQIPVTRKDLCSYARNIVNSEFPRFKPTENWASAFINRHNLSLGFKDFTMSEKIAVKEYAKEHGIRPAMRQFGISKAAVHAWVNKDFSDENYRRCETDHLPKSSRSRGPYTYDEGLDFVILAHVLEQQALQIPITANQLRCYARKIVQPQFPGFRANNTWVSKFIKRHNISLSPEDASNTGEQDRNFRRFRQLKVSTPREKNYKKFTLSEKLVVKEYAEKYGIRPAMRHFGISKSTVHAWSKIDFSADKSRNCKGHLPKSGRPRTYDRDLDKAILDHVLDQKRHKQPFTRKDLCSYARKIVKPKFPEFRASLQWADRFEKRHNICLRTRRSVADQQEKPK